MLEEISRKHKIKKQKVRRIRKDRNVDKNDKQTFETRRETERF